MLHSLHHSWYSHAVLPLLPVSTPTYPCTHETMVFGFSNPYFPPPCVEPTETRNDAMCEYTAWKSLASRVLTVAEQTSSQNYSPGEEPYRLTDSSTVQRAFLLRAYQGSRHGDVWQRGLFLLSNLLTTQSLKTSNKPSTFVAGPR